MADDKKISGLPVATTPTGSELLEIVQGGVNKQTTTQQIAALAAGGVSSVNGETGAVTLSAADVGADPAGTAGAVATNLSNHISDPADAHAGTAITNTPAGNIAATTVQAAINELDTEKAPLASPPFTGTPTVNGESVAPGLEAIAATGSAISFAVPQIYGSTASPITGNVTLVTTGLIPGMCQVMIHNDSTPPTWPAEFIRTNGVYAINQNNYVVMIAITASLILYTVSQQL